MCPVVVRRAETLREVKIVVEVLRLHVAAGVLNRSRLDVVVVVRESLRHRIHARMAAHAVVEEQAAVATGAATDVLPDTVGRQARIAQLLHVLAEMIDHGEPEHRAIGSGDEEGF